MEKQHEQRDVDVTGAKRGVWLVKVPKYLAEKWEQADGEVGKLRINNPKVKGGKPEVVFNLNQRLANQDASGSGKQCPRDHKFRLTGIDGQSLSVIGREPHAAPDGTVLPEKVSVQGKVIQRAECRPIVDTSYISLKKQKMELANKPQKQAQIIDRVQTYKPTTHHAHEVEHARKRKEEGKRSRLDKEAVMDLLFKAFEKHQYYNVRDLLQITQQPMPYLKEILKEICTYNMKAPHRSMWELKAEYRHYKADEKST